MSNDARITQDVIARYCRGNIDRPSAERSLKLAGISKDGARQLLDAADRNLTLKADYQK